MISEESCDTEDWSNGAEKKLWITGINYILKYTKTENSYFKYINYITVLTIFDPINVALVSRRDFFNLTDPKPLKCSVLIIKQQSSSQSISELHYTRCVICLKKLSPIAMISTPAFFSLLAAAMASSWDFPSVNSSRNCGVLGRAPTSSFRLFSRACMRAWPEK